jgi:hypothetical protein
MEHGDGAGRWVYTRRSEREEADKHILFVNFQDIVMARLGSPIVVQVLTRCGSVDGLPGTWAGNADISKVAKPSTTRLNDHCSDPSGESIGHLTVVFAQILQFSTLPRKAPNNKLDDGLQPVRS